MAFVLTTNSEKMSSASEGETKVEEADGQCFSNCSACNLKFQ